MSSIALASLGAMSVTAFAGGAVSAASPRDNKGAPSRGAPGNGHGNEGPGAATLTFTPATSTGSSTAGAGASAPAGTTTINVSSYDFTGPSTLNIGSQSSGAGAGKVTFSPLVVTAPLSPQVTNLIANFPDHFQTAELTVGGPGGTSALNAKFVLVTLNQYQISSDSGGTVTLTLQYGAVQLAPSATSSSGS